MSITGRIHFIAVGGAVMHNLAIALHRKGYTVTGSDDEIFEPSRSRLAYYGLLPATEGWHPGRITPDIDTVILGMHARADNPELEKARKLGIKVISFPEYIYEQTKEKKRIVVAGSHGKTTTTAIIMHVLKHAGVEFDYLVGSSVTGFETMVGLSDKSLVAVLEGDEYLTSPVDRRPKFHIYKPDIAIIIGIAWDHMNVFPTFENYVEQFRIFSGTITPGGALVYNKEDREVVRIAELSRTDVIKIPFSTHGYFTNSKGFFGVTHNRTVPLRIFGEHNMQNLAAAKEACLLAGITEDQFYEAVTSFEGTAKRLQKIAENEKGIAYIDFAHAPSKVRATLEAVAETYMEREIIACLELHTFSSLNKEFLPQYKGTLSRAGKAFVYFNRHAAEIKKLEALSEEDVMKAFDGKNVSVFSDSQKLFNEISKSAINSPVIVFMSSGDFDGRDVTRFVNELLQINK